MSVLENYHIAQTFGVMGSQNTSMKRVDRKSINIPDFTGINYNANSHNGNFDIMENFSKQDYKKAR